MIDERLIKPILDDAAQGVLIEGDERIVYINPGYAQLLGQSSPAPLLGQHVGEIIADADAGRLLEFGRRRNALGGAPSSYAFDARRHDGHSVRLHAEVSVSLIGNLSFILSIVRPVWDALSQPNVPADPYESSGSHHRLSKREMQVFRLILDGKRLKEIALLLNISVKTISTHRARLLKKLAVTDNRELFQYSLRHGLIDWSSPVVLNSAEIGRNVG